MLREGEEAPPPALVPTVADVVSVSTGRDWNRILVERIGAWAATYFDEGQASWRSPWLDLRPYKAFRAEASLDRTPEVFGCRGFRAIIQRLPQRFDRRRGAGAHPARRPREGARPVLEEAPRQHRWVGGVRRALEEADQSCETIGFAGFFGFPVEYVPLRLERGGAQCPVLFLPKGVVTESVVGATAGESARVAQARVLARRARTAWKSFKTSAVACFGFVGPVGLAYLPKLIGDALCWTRTVPHPSRDGVGTVGVLEGNGGDLRVGLSWQAVHDGERLVHEPLRLSVLIEAPVAAMNAILEKHASVRALVDNGWLHLFALDDAGAVMHRYARGLAWEPVHTELAA